MRGRGKNVAEKRLNVFVIVDALLVSEGTSSTEAWGNGSSVDDVVIERGGSDETVKSGDGKDEFGREQPPWRENGGIAESSVGEVTGRWSAGKNRGEISGLGGTGILLCHSSCLNASIGVFGRRENDVDNF